jgi:hypothetical protein
MLDNISFQSTPSTAQIACLLGAGAFLGRKVVMAEGCKAMALVAEYLGQENAAEWDEAGDKYLKLAKKDFLYDLAGAVSIGGFGYLAAGISAGILKGGIAPDPRGLNEKILDAGKSVQTTAEKMTYSFGTYIAALCVETFAFMATDSVVTARVSENTKLRVVAGIIAALVSGGFTFAITEKIETPSQPIPLGKGFVASIISNLGFAGLFWGFGKCIKG